MLNSQYLKIGDYITLFAEQCGGYMVAEGFNAAEVSVQKCGQKIQKMMPNMRNMVFRVMPKLVYEVARDYHKEKKVYDQLTLEAEAQEKTLDEDKKTQLYGFIMQPFRNQERDMVSRLVTVLHQRMTQEQEQNRRIIRSRQGGVVNYGSQVQLLHVDSGSYLQVSKQETSIRKDWYRFELSSNPSPSRVIFDILPRYKYRQDGDRVVYEDHILLFNSSKSLYIQYMNDAPLPVEEPTQMPSTFRPNCPHRREQMSALFQRYEVNCGTESKKWQIFQYRQHMDDHKAMHFVFGGDVIRLKHAESGGYICLDDDGKLSTGEQQAYLRIYTGSMTGEDADENLTTNQLFEVEMDLDSELGQACTWENEKTKDTIRYRFRHLNSGRVLTIKTISKNDKDIYVIVSSQMLGREHVLKSALEGALEPSEYDRTMDEAALMGSLFTLKSSTIDNDNFINNDTVVKIMSCMNNYYLSAVKQRSPDEEEEEEGEQDSAVEALDMLLADQEEEAKEEEKPEGGDSLYANVFTPMNKEEFDYLKSQTLMLRRSHKEEDVFIMKKAEHQEVSDLLFIHSCVAPLKQYLFSIRRKLTESLSVPYFIQLEQLLASMVFFLTETESMDPFQCEGIPYKRRQKYMRETRVIDLLVDMLYYPFKDGLYQFGELTQKHPVTRICQLVYRLLKHCVKDYNYNKFYVAQFIELYFNQAMTATEQNNFRAERTITELLKNNEVLLDKQITKETIINFVELCKGQTKNERFLNLLATLCSCNGEAVNSNQDDTCEVMLENEENNTALIMKMVQTPQMDYEIILSEPEIDPRTMFISISNLYQVSLKRDDLRIFNYFVALINLNAEMCLQRNYRGINSLDSVYPVEQVFECTVNENVQMLLRASFAKFLLFLHIDKAPLEEITVPDLSRVWSDIVHHRTKLPQSQAPITPKLLELKPFVARFFSELGGVQKAFETDFNTYIVELLGVVDAMVKLGFYKDEQDLILIVDPLIQLLDGSLDVIDLADPKASRSVGETGRVDSLSASQGASSSKRLAEELAHRQKRYHVNESNLLIMSTKTKIINILQRILDIQNDVRLTEFLTAFHKNSDPVPSEEATFIEQVNQSHNLEELFAKDQALADLKPSVDERVVSWVNKAYGNKKLSLDRISQSDFICVLLDLILYENAALVNNAFKLLVCFFTQKQAILDLASNVQILEEEQDVRVLHCVNGQLKEMKWEADNAEFWLGFGGRPELIKARNFMERLDMLGDLCIRKDERVYDFQDNDRLNRSITRNEVAGLIRKRGKNRASESEQQLLNDTSEMTADWEDDDTKVIQLEEENDEKYQRLLRNLNAQEMALIIIRQGVLDEAESSAAYLRVLERAYVMLIRFVRNNRENQLLLMEKIEEFLGDVEHGVHAFELIAEILRNNEKLSSYNLAPIVRKVCQLADDLSIETSKKTTLLSFLRDLMICNGVVLKDFQSMILAEITSAKRKNSMHIFTQETGFEAFEGYLEEMTRHYRSNVLSEAMANPEIYLPNEMAYTIQFIHLLARSGSGRNALTELKCQSILSISDITACLKVSSFCYPMKSTLLQFLYEIYLDTEKAISDDHYGSLWDVVEIMYEDLKKFVEIKLNRQPSDAANKKRGSLDTNVDISRNFNIRDCFGSVPVAQIFESYIYQQVMQNLNKFFEMRLDLSEKQTNLVRNIIRLVAETSKHVPKGNAGHVRNINALYKTIWKVPQLKALTENLKTQAVALINERPQGQEEGSNKITKAVQLEAYMKSAMTSEEVRNEVELEFQELILSIMFIKKKSEKGFNGSNTLDTTEILKSLIRITDVQSEIDTDLRCISLKILRKIIEMENKDLTTPAAEWDTDDWAKYEFQVIERQNMMTSLGMIKLICRIVSNDTSLSLKEEAFLSGIALLLGGNEKAQMKFHRYMQKDSENLFVLKLKETITECYELIKKTEIQRNVMMQKQYSLSGRIEELTNLVGNPEHPEVKKLEQQLMVIEDEMQEFELQFETNDSEVLTPKRALSYLQVIFRFMQLLCEGHNIELQNMLREQVNVDGNVAEKTYDFISMFARYLGEFYKFFSSYTCDVGQQMVDSLIEFIQGPCQGNQVALIQSKIIDSSRDFIAGFEKPSEYLPLGFTESEEDIEKISEFKSKIVTLLLSLLEGDLDLQKVQDMSSALDFTVVKDRMLNVFTIFAKSILEVEELDIANLKTVAVSSRLQKDSFESSINEAFELFILMKTLAQNNEVAMSNLQRKTFTTEQWKAFDFVTSHTGKIEVNVNGTLQAVYFPIRPACQYLSDESKKKLMLEVNRESQSTKVEGLMNATADLIDEMLHNERLSRNKWSITPQRLNMLKDASTGLALILNFLLIAFVIRVDNYRTVYIPDAANQTITYCGIVQLVLSGSLIVCYTLARGGLITKAKWRDYIKENSRKYQPFENEDRLEITQMNIEMTHTILITQGPESSEFDVDGERNFGNLYTKVEYYMFNILFFMQDPIFIYYCVYTMISVIGLLYLNVFYSLHLLDFVARSPTLQNVIRSVTKNGGQFALTAVLMIVIIYIYTTIGFFYLQDLFVDTGVNKFENNPNENFCRTLLECFVVHVNLGLRAGGGIGDVDLPITYDLNEEYFVKLFYDTLFHIMITIIMISILFGIVIDTFADLRDEKEKKEEDMRNVCFICHIERNTFDKYADGFEKHIQRDHNLWQYVFYIVHLQSKDSNDYTGIESYVMDKYQNREASWIPLMKSISLQGTKFETSEAPEQEGEGGEE